MIIQGDIRESIGGNFRDLFLYILSVVFFQGLVFFHQLANEKSCMPNFTEFNYAQEVTFLQIYIINDNNGF